MTTHRDMKEKPNLRNVNNQFHEKSLNRAFGEGALKLVDQQVDDSLQPRLPVAAAAQ